MLTSEAFVIAKAATRAESTDALGKKSVNAFT